MLLRYILGDSGGVGRVDGIFVVFFNRGAKSFYPLQATSSRPPAPGSAGSFRIIAI